MARVFLLENDVPSRRERSRHVAPPNEVIARFGRFPARNAILGRRSTPAVIAYIEDGDTVPTVAIS